MALPILDGNQSATTLSTIITGGAHIPAHTVVSLGSQAISDIASGVSGSVISISNFPATQTIAGTVTANLDSANLGAINFFDGGDFLNAGLNAIKGLDPASWLQTGGGDVPISGTVTVGASSVTFNANIGTRSDGSRHPLSLESGSNYLNARVFASDIIPFLATVTIGNSVTIGSLPAISGTVTVGAMPNGALTTRFGSVTTANTAQITSAVTNTSRKYLLAQNISAGTVTIGIGFSPTTTQGIQLTAGGGLTFDAFCPTGAVYWLGAVTGAAFTILEG